MFKIIPDRTRKMLKVESSGLGTVEEVEDFGRRQDDLLQQLCWQSGGFVMLLHTLDTIVQTQAVMTALVTHLSTCPIKARRIAIVKGGALAGMQTKRSLDGDHAALFATVPDAEAWLFS